MSIRKGTAIWIAVLLLFVCAVIFAELVLRPREMKVAVLFAGYTNDSRGTLLARLRVVNEGNVKIRRERMYILETKQQARLYPGSPFLSGNVLLDPGESEVVTIPAITNQGAWRAAFLCFPSGLKMQVTDRMGPMRMNDPAWKMRLYRWAGPANGPIHSKWIEARNGAAQTTAPLNDGPAAIVVNRDGSDGSRDR